MASSFNTQGSTAGNPVKGLLGNASTDNYGLPNPFGNTSTGLIGSINKATGLSPAPTSQGTTPGILKPTTPVKSTTDVQGNTTTYHAPKSDPNVLAQQQALNAKGAGLVEDGIAGPKTEAAIAKYGNTTGTPPPPVDESAPANATAPGTNGNNGSNFNQNLTNVQTASTPSPAYQNTINQANQIQSGIIAPVTQALNKASTAGYSMGGASLGQNAAAVENAPTIGGLQSNLNGELELLNTQGGAQLAGAGETLQGLGTLAGQELSGSQLQTQGAENVAGLTQPQPYGVTSTPYAPGTNTFGTLPSGGSGSLSSVGSLLATQDQGNQVQTMKGIQSQAQSLGANLSALITQAGINPANASVFTTGLNGINQWLNNQSGDPQYQNFANLISEVASKYSNILNQSGGTPTDVSQTTHNIMNGLASGQSIQQVLQSLDKNATDSINSLDTTSKASAGTVSAGGYNYKQVNGKWVPA